MHDAEYLPIPDHPVHEKAERSQQHADGKQKQEDRQFAEPAGIEDEDYSDDHAYRADHHSEGAVGPRTRLVRVAAVTASIHRSRNCHSPHPLPASVWPVLTQMILARTPPQSAGPSQISLSEDQLQTQRDLVVVAQ
ncbi:hypothetical protein TspCOW1_27230 [Thiohalobacter sp. COW1]|nr:hypothetical protein TspCOW1_27230 [Thiohalobacter sp. COW1]